MLKFFLLIKLNILKPLKYKIVSDEEEVRGSGFLKQKNNSKNILDRTYLQNNLKNEKMLLTGYKVKR